MYESFFGLCQHPFSLVPDPEFLFLGAGHQEVLAHLDYAVFRQEGFAAITGEVGTGKTTLCRAFLDRMGHRVSAAFIFNPRLDSLQLLKAIGDEWGIDTSGDTIKALIDALNQFLIQQRREAKPVLVVIDEAQNLAPDVLEQLRLLSNLETAKHKLLQIILLGQPELDRMLNAYPLRPLRQRISLRCHLVPLTRAETRAYVAHRMQVASAGEPSPFSPASLATIYRFSGGVPRLINMACDRALLVAWGQNSHRVTQKMARKAIAELADARNPNGAVVRRKTAMAAGLGVFALLLLATAFFNPQRLELPAGILRGAHPAASVKMATAPVETHVLEDASRPPAKKEPAPVASVEIMPASGPPVPVEPVIDRVPVDHFFALDALLSGIDPQRGRKQAMETVFGLWTGASGLDPAKDLGLGDDAYFQLCARHAGLKLLRVPGDLFGVRALDLPAILPVQNDSGAVVYLALVGADGKNLVIQNGEGKQAQVTPEALSARYSGQAYVPWKNFLEFSDRIPVNRRNPEVISLKLLLRRLGAKIKDLSPVYDKTTQQAIRTIQSQHGLAVDGVVGPMTQILLYQMAKHFPMPKLTK